jgi:hypothetical protein
MNRQPLKSKLKILEEKKMSGNMNKIIVILSLVLLSAIAIVSLMIAFAGGVRGIGLLGVWFFSTFGVIIILAQLIPAGILISSFMKTIFSSFRKGEIFIRAT